MTNRFTLIEDLAFDSFRRMHFLLTYGVNQVNHGQLAAIQQQIAGALRPYRYHQALGNSYIIRINTQQEWTQILQALQAIAQTSPIPLNFLMTPPVPQGTRYNGWMPQASWNEINGLTD